MKPFKWAETTPEWTRPNPYRRHDGFAESTQTSIRLERTGGLSEGWFWLVFVPHETGQFKLPGGDLPDDDAKRLAPLHLANQLRRVLADLEAA